MQSGTARLLINGQPAWEMATGLIKDPAYIGIEGEGRKLEVRRIELTPLP